MAGRDEVLKSVLRDANSPSALHLSHTDAYRIKGLEWLVDWGGDSFLPCQNLVHLTALIRWVVSSKAADEEGRGVIFSDTFRAVMAYAHRKLELPLEEDTPLVYRSHLKEWTSWKVRAEMSLRRTDALVASSFSG